MSKKNNYRGMQFVGVGFELIVIGIGAIVIGQKFDQQYKTNGIFTISLLMICLAGWVYHLVFLLKKFMKEEEESD